MRHQTAKLSGFTLFEIIISMAILGMISFVLLINYNSARSNQALLASAEGLAANLRTAHIYTRELKDNKIWGIISSGDDQYQLVSGSQTNHQPVFTSTLEKMIKFDGTFTIWFIAGTGEVSSDTTIVMKNSLNKSIKVTVLKTGTVEVSSIY